MDSVISFTENQKRLANMLFDVGAIKDKTQSKSGLGFKLKLHEQYPDAPLSPIYLNLRATDHPLKSGPLTSDIVDDLGKQLFDLACEHKLLDVAPYVAGVPYAGDPLAEAFLYAPMKNGSPLFPRIKLSKQSALDGRRNINGFVHFPSRRRDGDPVLLIDDLITTATSKLEAIKVLEEAQFRVTAICAVIDREQGGATVLKNAGYQVYSIFKLPELLRYYCDVERIFPEQYGKIVRYLRLPV